MQECVCPHQSQIRQLSEAVNGNGKDGLKTDVKLLQEQMKTVEESLSSLSTTYSGLYRAQIEHDVIEKEKIKIKSQRTDMWQKIGIFVASGGTLLGIVKMILTYLQNNT